MIQANRWRALFDWIEKLPLRIWLCLIPPLTPIVAPVAIACFCPMTTAFSAVVLIATYTHLIRRGIIELNWNLLLTGLWKYYVFAIFVTFYCGLMGAYQEWSSSPAKPTIRASRPRTDSHLWDRDIDG